MKYLPLGEEGLKRVVNVFYQIIMSHNDDNGLIFGYALLHHVGPDASMMYQLSSRNNICSSVYFLKSTLNECG
jgi:hypothetical protein